MWWVVVTNKHVDRDSIKFAYFWHKNYLLGCKNTTNFLVCQDVFNNKKVRRVGSARIAGQRWPILRALTFWILFCQEKSIKETSPRGRNNQLYKINLIG